jgi:Tfp pilus assembly protein PilV
LVIVAWTIAELLGYAKGERNSNILFSLASVMVNVALFAVIMLVLAAASANRSSMESRQAKGGLLRESMLRLLGVNQHHEPSKRNDTEEWNGRANYLERQMKRIANDQRVLAGQQAKTMETLVTQTEIRLKAELENLEDNFIILRESLLHEVKGTKRTNQFVTIAVQELKTMLVSASTTYRTPVPSEVNVDRTRTVYTEDRDL